MSAARPRDWDAVTYDRVSGPQAEWAEAVLGRMTLAGHETVLDAGCGSGRVTRMLLDRLPRGRVIGLDASPAMIEHARAQLGDEVTLRCQDLLDLDLDQAVDVVFSNATFHWVSDHGRLFTRIHDALRPGGTLTAQCGGFENVASVHALARSIASESPFAEHLGDWEEPWVFATVEETEPRLRAAGLEPLDVRLTPWPVTPDEPAAFLRTVILGPHLAYLPDDLHAAFVDAVVGALPDPITIDYVRLDIDARRPG